MSRTDRAEIVASKKRAPTREIEKALWAQGHDVVVGIDEVGRGAWAGPLMVGAAHSTMQPVVSCPAKVSVC